MNKHICLAVGAYLWGASSLSNALHTIDKTPREGTHYYKVKYSIEDEFYSEHGILKEIITHSSSESSDSCSYVVHYNYHNYELKINNNLIDIGANNKDIQLNSTVQVDKNWRILSTHQCHPIVFYLTNLRSGIISSFDKKGEFFSVNLKNDYRSYQKPHDSSIEYTITHIQQANNSHSKNPTYTFAWTVVDPHRHGKIQVDSKGLIYRINIYAPTFISEFYKTPQFESSTGWLNLSRIDHKKFKKLYSKNPMVKDFFESNETPSSKKKDPKNSSQSTFYKIWELLKPFLDDSASPYHF